MYKFKRRLWLLEMDWTGSERRPEMAATYCRVSQREFFDSLDQCQLLNIKEMQDFTAFLPTDSFHRVLVNLELNTFLFNPRDYNSEE